MKTTLYQKDSAGNIKVWTIEVIDHGDKSEILTTSGRIDGAITPNSTFISEGKNDGKLNQTTHYTQALADAQSKINSKIKRGYVADINNVKESHELGTGIKQPMLAQKYDPAGKQNGSKTLDKIGIKGKMIVYQDKKDGNRCYAKVWKDATGFHCTKTSRKGEEFAPLPHIDKQIIECFSKIYDYVNKNYDVTEYVVDGELFSAEMSFNKSNGLVKNFSRTPEQEELSKKIKYHVYDVVLPVGYETRDKVKNYFKNTDIIPLKSTYTIADESVLESALENALERGEEGLIIRQLGIPYEHKRTWQLCKYKIFQDSEFKVTGFEESVRGGMVGAIVCETKDGKVFKAACKFDHEERTKIWETQKDYIGKIVTVEFFSYSEYGIPRFPKATKFRETWDK